MYLRLILIRYDKTGVSQRKKSILRDPKEQGHVGSSQEAEEVRESLYCEHTGRNGQGKVDTPSKFSISLSNFSGFWVLGVFLVVWHLVPG